jgi:hypothetical protein
MLQRVGGPGTGLAAPIWVLLTGLDIQPPALIAPAHEVSRLDVKAVAEDQPRKPIPPHGEDAGWQSSILYQPWVVYFQFTFLCSISVLT